MIALAGYFAHQKGAPTDWQLVDMQANLGF
jgi:hypothetical protein